MSRELREEIERLGAELAREREEGASLRAAHTDLAVQLHAAEAERDRWKLRARTMRDTVVRERQARAAPPVATQRGSGGGRRRPPATPRPISGARVLR